MILFIYNLIMTFRERLNDLQDYLEEEYWNKLKIHLTGCIENRDFKNFDSEEIIDDFLQEAYNTHYYQVDDRDMDMFNSLRFQETLIVVEELQDYYEEFDMKPSVDNTFKLINEYKYYYANHIWKEYEEKEILLSVLNKIYRIDDENEKYGRLKNLAFKLQVKQDLNNTKLSDDLVDRIIKLV